MADSAIQLLTDDIKTQTGTISSAAMTAAGMDVSGGIITISLDFVPSIFIFSAFTIAQVEGGPSWIWNGHGADTTRPGFDFDRPSLRPQGESRISLRFSVPAGTTNMQIERTQTGVFSFWQQVGFIAIQFGGGP